MCVAQRGHDLAKGHTAHGPSPRESWVCPSPSSAGCFFGDEVRGGGESRVPSDSEAKRPGPDPEHDVEVAGPASAPASAPAELPWTNIDLKEPKKGPSHAAADFPEATNLSSLPLLPLGLEEPDSANCHALWAWVSGGGCAVEAHTTLKWFTVHSGKGNGPAPQRVPQGRWGRPDAPTVLSPSFWSLPRPAQAVRRKGVGLEPLPSPCPSSGGHSRLTWGTSTFPSG